MSKSQKYYDLEEGLESLGKDFKSLENDMKDLKQAQEKLQQSIQELKNSDDLINKKISDLTNNSAMYYETAEKLKGLAVLDEKFLVKALECYDKAIKLDPDNPFIISQRAELLYEMKEHDKALADIQVVQKLIRDQSNESTQAISAKYTIEELLDKLSLEDGLDEKLFGAITSEED